MLEFYNKDTRTYDIPIITDWNTKTEKVFKITEDHLWLYTFDKRNSCDRFILIYWYEDGMRINQLCANIQMEINWL